MLQHCRGSAAHAATQGSSWQPTPLAAPRPAAAASQRRDRPPLAPAGVGRGAGCWLAAADRPPCHTLPAETLAGTETEAASSWQSDHLFYCNNNNGATALASDGAAIPSNNMKGGQRAAVSVSPHSGVWGGGGAALCMPAWRTGRASARRAAAPPPLGGGPRSSSLRASQLHHKRKPPRQSEAARL
jgi:hypothetical protein